MGSNEDQLRNIISASDSFILSENVYKSGTERKAYLRGSYEIKVETGKYSALIAQLKSIGKIQSFNENARDVTGQYTNTGINLEIEKTRLDRYMKMYDEAIKVEDKINLNDRIFDQERKIKYLEDSLKNIDKKIEYSTVYFSMNEERSEYANVVLVKFSELVRTLVGSFNGLLGFIFVIIPWALFILIVKVIWNFIKRR